jgi:hypothetical protein
MTCEAFGLACVLLISRSSKIYDGSDNMRAVPLAATLLDFGRAIGPQAVAAIYLRNVFPDLKVTWGSHPNNTGHNDSPGCFRCHDGSATSNRGPREPWDFVRQPPKSEWHALQSFVTVSPSELV